MGFPETSPGNKAQHNAPNGDEPLPQGSEGHEEHNSYEAGSTEAERGKKKEKERARKSSIMWEILQLRSVEGSCPGVSARSGVPHPAPSPQQSRHGDALRQVKLSIYWILLQKPQHMNIVLVLKECFWSGLFCFFFFFLSLNLVLTEQGAGEGRAGRRDGSGTAGDVILFTANAPGPG